MKHNTIENLSHHLWDNTQPVFPAIDLHALMASQRRIAREKNKSRAGGQQRKMFNLFDSKISSSNDLHPLIVIVKEKKKKK